MKKICRFFNFNLKALLALSVFAISSQAIAVPLKIDSDVLTAAAKIVSKEQRDEAAKKDPNTVNVENYCKKMLNFRLGGKYVLSVTDRLVPTATADKKIYTIVGNADRTEEDKLSYKCKVEIKANKSYDLMEFQLYKVEAKEKL